MDNTRQHNKTHLREHQIELVIDAREDLTDGGGVGQHAASPLESGNIASLRSHRGLRVDTALETSGRPIHKLDAPVGLDLGNRSSHVLGYNISSVHHTDGHVLAVSGIALGHHGSGIKHSAGQLCGGKPLVDGPLGGDDRGIRAEQEVDARIRHQVDLELVDIDVQLSLEAQRSGQGRDDLRNHPVQVGVGGLLKAQLVTADVVNSFVVQHEGHIGVLQEGMSGEDRVVGLYDGGGDLWRREDAEIQFRLLSVVNRQTLQEKGTKARAGTSSDGVEDEEALQTLAVFDKFAYAVHDLVNVLLADSVTTSGKVVGGIFLA